MKMIWIAGALIAAAAIAVCWYFDRRFGWLGLFAALAIFTVICGIQFYHAAKLMRVIREAPEGITDDAVKLAQCIKPGMSILKIVEKARALGRKVASNPVIYEWRDPQHCLQVTLSNQKAAEVTLSQVTPAKAVASATIQSPETAN